MISIVVAIIMVTGRVLFVMMRDRVAFSVVKNVLVFSQIRLEKRQNVDITMVLHNLMMIVLIRSLIVINNLIKSVMGAVWSLVMQSTMLVCPKKLFIAWNSWHVVSVFFCLNAMDIVADLVMRHTIMFNKSSIIGRVSVLIRCLIQVREVGRSHNRKIVTHTCNLIVFFLSIIDLFIGIVLHHVMSMHTKHLIVIVRRG